jgi:hypothetical protein
LGQNLVELNLQVNNFEGYYCDGFYRAEGYLSSLVEMRSLRHLSVDIESRVGDRVFLQEEVPELANVLPPSLETLHLHWDEKYFTEIYRRRCDHVNGAVRKFLEHRRMPNLRQVGIERYFNETLLWRVNSMRR